jgi:CDP-diacylglycerol--serine O-phosphatidyltransferase
MSGGIAVYGLITKIDFIVPICILVSIVCDFFDGFVARKMNIQSSIGKELDSLADVISFGLVPCFMLLRMFNPTMEFKTSLIGLLLFILPFTIAVYSAFRLAKFNLETRDSEYFYGLNTPSNTLMILGVYLSWLSNDFNLIDFLDQNWILLMVTVITINYLLISNTPMFSNKSIKKQFKGNLPFLLVSIIGLVSIIFFKYIGISLAIMTYVLLSILVLRLKWLKL